MSVAQAGCSEIVQQRTWTFEASTGRHPPDPPVEFLVGPGAKSPLSWGLQGVPLRMLYAFQRLAGTVGSAVNSESLEAIPLSAANLAAIF